jgi:hypothetical protein
MQLVSSTLDITGVRSSLRSVGNSRSSIIPADNWGAAALKMSNLQSHLRLQQQQQQQQHLKVPLFEILIYAQVS